MNLHFTNPGFLYALPVALAWVAWWAWRSDVQIGRWRRILALVLRLVIVCALGLALAGFQFLKPREGTNVYFVLDRSDSIPPAQQESALKYVNQAAVDKKKEDQGGVVVFGTDAALESTVKPMVDLQKVHAVIGTERSDIASAIRLATAAFPETGQRRLVVATDGNENIGDAVAAVLAAKPLGVTVDVLPLGVERGQDVLMQKFTLPARAKVNQTFEAKVVVNADQAQKAVLRFYRNEQYFGEQDVQLDPGKNVFALPLRVEQAGFYSYSVAVDAPRDRVPQNNRATSFLHVRDNPRLLLVSDDPGKDRELLEALQTARYEIKSAGVNGFPETLAELQSYDSIFLHNISAGDLGGDLMKLLASAVRDFGVGLVCLGGDQAFTAGGYRGTPLEEALPLNMELDSKKVMPKGALVLIMHGMEFPGANQTARDTAVAALNALGPQDELGILLWDGNERWLLPLQAVGDKKKAGAIIAGMNQGDMVSFHNTMTMAAAALKASRANLKHIVVFSDGDPGAPTQQLMQQIADSRITVSTVMIGGHVQPNTMIWMANMGKGRFYDVPTGAAAKIPEIFIKEAAVILKSAIYEDPFKPQQVANSDLVRGISAAAYPPLLGYVCTTPKARAETPLMTDKGDPLLAHWQFGLGRVVAFTSDARSRWAKNWLAWPQYRQFWTQIANWSQRQVEDADFTAEVTMDKGEGMISMEAVDKQGNYRNFLDLRAVVVSPKGERQMARLEQTGPGHYEVKFSTKEIGAYLINLMEMHDGQPRGSMVVGASVNFSPEFSASEPNLALLKQLTELSGGKFLNPILKSDNPFLRDRKKTFQPVDLWEWLVKFAILTFLMDVGVRRIQIDKEEWLKATRTLRQWLFFWSGKPRPVEADESLASLLAKREQVRAQYQPPAQEIREDLFKPSQPVSDKPVIIANQNSSFPREQPAQPPPASIPSPPAKSSTAERLLAAKKRAMRHRE